MPKPSKPILTLDQLEAKWGADQVVDLLDVLHFQAKDSYAIDDPELLKMQELYDQIQSTGSIEAAIAAMTGKSPELEEPFSQSSAKSAKQATNLPRSSNSDHLNAGLTRMQQADDEQTVLNAAAAAYSSIRKHYKMIGMTYDAFAQGRRPKDPRLAKMHDLTMNEVSAHFQAQTSAFFGLSEDSIDEIDFSNFGNHLNTGSFADPEELDALFDPAPQASILGQSH